MTDQPARLTFEIPLTPPSVNHYVTHGGGIHKKHPEAKAWEAAFAATLPAAIRGQYVVSASGRFHVVIEIFLAPRESGDWDNFPKVPCDCIAKAGMLRNSKLEPVNDAVIKHGEVIIRDSQADRQLGPKTRITIEAL